MSVSISAKNSTTMRRLLSPSIFVTCLASPLWRNGHTLSTVEGCLLKWYLKGICFRKDSRAQFVTRCVVWKKKIIYTLLDLQTRSANLKAERFIIVPEIYIIHFDVRAPRLYARIILSNDHERRIASNRQLAERLINILLPVLHLHDCVHKVKNTTQIQFPMANNNCPWITAEGDI